jgi:hypothetical protein
MDREEYWIMTNKNLGPHLGAHASSVLPPTAKKPATTNKVRKTAKTSCPAPYFPHVVTDNRTPGTTIRPLHNSGQSSEVRVFPMVSLPHAPTLNSEDNTAHNRLHISRRNPVIFNYEVSAVPALNNSANSATANKLNREFATDPQWASKRRNTPLKNPSISAVTAVESGPIMVVQWASENGSPTCALKPHTNRKIRKHQHEQHERNMNPGKISTISMNSMPTHVDIGGVAPGRPLQFVRGHSGDPNAIRPQFTEKSGKNSANSASTAKPGSKGNGALAPPHPSALKRGDIPLKNPSKTAVTVVAARPRVRSSGLMLPRVHRQQPRVPALRRPVSDGGLDLTSGHLGD